MASCRADDGAVEPLRERGLECGRFAQVEALRETANKTTPLTALPMSPSRLASCAIPDPILLPGVTRPLGRE